MNKIIFSLLSAMIFISCASSKKIVNQQIPGNYLGELPCADCSEIRTSIQLYDDFTYQKKTIYLGKSDKVETIKSNWKIMNDSILLLNDQNHQQAFLYKKDKLVMLSQQREMITGNLAYRYQLFKITDEDTQKPNFSELINNDISFVGQGNEPFWSVELMVNQSLKLKQPGVEDILFNIIESVYNKDVSIHKAINNNTIATLKIYSFPCINDMSGNKTDKYVEFERQNTVLKGCGYALKQDFEWAGKWCVSYLKDTDLKQIGEEKLPYIDFITDKTQLKGYLGCNGFGTTYTIQNKSIKIEKIISTMMACPELAIEQKFSQALQNTNRFSLEGEKLNFFKDESLLISFTR
jgi:uncharacterized membrane protein